MNTKRFIAAALLGGTSVLALASPALADKWESYDVHYEVDVVTGTELDDDGAFAWGGMTNGTCATYTGVVCDNGPTYTAHEEISVPVEGAPTVVVDVEAGKQKNTNPNYKPERDDVCEPILEETADFCFGRITPEEGL